jgi:predicted glutamine amidotransferase
MEKNSQCQRKIKAATQYRLNQELKFLYIKKQKLNERLYRIHIEQNKTSSILTLLES